MTILARHSGKMSAEEIVRSWDMLQQVAAYYNDAWVSENVVSQLYGSHCDPTTWVRDHLKIVNQTSLVSVEKKKILYHAMVQYLYKLGLKIKNTRVRQKLHIYKKRSFFSSRTGRQSEPKSQRKRVWARGRCGA